MEEIDLKNLLHMVNKILCKKMNNLSLTELILLNNILNKIIVIKQHEHEKSNKIRI